jgi:hypothetical protein
LITILFIPLGPSSPTDWWTLLNCETIPIVKKVDIFALLVKYRELSHISQEKF